jgi:hypothetical protein
MSRLKWNATTVEHVVVVQDGEYLTPPKIFNMGIWACYTCGEINNLESGECRFCGDAKFFVVMKYDTIRQIQQQVVRVVSSVGVGDGDVLLTPFFCSF